MLVNKFVVLLFSTLTYCAAATYEAVWSNVPNCTYRATYGSSDGVSIDIPISTNKFKFSVSDNLTSFVYVVSVNKEGYVSGISPVIYFEPKTNEVQKLFLRPIKIIAKEIVDEK